MRILQSLVSAWIKLTLSPVFEAMQRGDLQSVESLVQRRRHLLATDEWGFTAFMIATRDGHTDLALRMLELGASAHHVSKAGATPLGVAALAGDTRVGKALLERGVDPNTAETDPDGAYVSMTPLMWASNRRHPQFAKLLLKAGADVNRVNGQNQTALMFADDGTPDSNAVLDVLLRARPNLQISDWRGRTIIDEAKARAKNSGRNEMKHLIALHFPEFANEMQA